MSRYFASTHDVGPTVLSMVGIDRPDWMDGSDLSPLLDGEQPAQRRDYHYGGMYNRFYIRTDDNVLIGDNRGKERHMYDLRVDPHEYQNIEPQNRKLSEELYQQVLEARAGRCPTTCRRSRPRPGHDQHGAGHPRGAHPLAKEGGRQEGGDHDARLAHRGHGRRRR